MQCAYLLPTFDHYHTPNREMVRCLLEYHSYTTHHLSRLPNGRVIRWYYECADIEEGGCKYIEECEDFVSYEVDESEIPVKAQ